MARMSGWQKAGLVAGIGCFSIVGILVLGLVIAVVWARSTLSEMGDTTPVKAERTFAIPPPAPAATIPPGGGATATEPLHLTLELAEGRFTIEPGEPGAQVRIDGSWAPALYELTNNREADETGTTRQTIRFRAKAPAWARFFAGMFNGDSGQEPEVRVIVPRDVPLDLALSVSMGQSRINLGGLAISDLEVNLSMGEHRLDFSEPVAEAVRRVRLNASMGEVSVQNLGNTRAQVIETNGSMGNFTADLGGDWKPGATTDVSFDQSMGELTVRVPAGVRLETDISNSMAETRRPEGAQPDDAAAPLLKLRMSTSMGESRVVRY